MFPPVFIYEPRFLGFYRKRHARISLQLYELAVYQQILEVQISAKTISLSYKVDKRSQLHDERQLFYLLNGTVEELY